MLSSALTNAINEQITLELSSAYVYLGMALWCQDHGFKGAAHWFQKQFSEEQGHAFKLMTFLQDRDAQVALQNIPAPNADYASFKEVFEMALKHEQHVTASINKLYELSLTENDYPTQIMLQWFIKEQVEEENTVKDILDNFKMVGEHGSAMFMLDRSLGSRE
jgi:ferritin